MHCKYEITKYLFFNFILIKNLEILGTDGLLRNINIWLLIYFVICFDIDLHYLLSYCLTSFEQYSLFLEFQPYFYVYELETHSILDLID